MPIEVLSNEERRGPGYQPPALLVRNHPVVTGMEDWIHMVSLGVAEYSPEALARVTEVMSAPKSIRHSRFSPSTIGSCLRKQAFSYLDMQPDVNSDATLMYLGTWAHLRWQLVGLTMGFLSEIEVQVPRDPGVLPIWGSIDGICRDGTGFELKTTGDRAFHYVAKHGPSMQYKDQIQAYMELGDIDEFVLVYENRADGSTMTWLMQRSKEWGEKLMAKVSRAVSDLEDGILPLMLPKCVQKTGFDYVYCQYKISCPDQGNRCSTTELT